MANDTKYGVADDRMADETQPFVDIEHLEHCVNLLLAEDRVGRHPLEFLLVHEAVPIHVEYPVIVTSDLISSSAA